jgi:hypothetical protein
LSKKTPALVPLALLVALALAATAFAVKPKEGGFAYLQKDGLESVSFVVEGGEVQSVSASSVGCNGGAPAAITKKIAVKGSGKFTYKGKASFVTGDETKMKLKGKFVSSKKAKGSAAFGGCDTEGGAKGKVKIPFTAKWHEGG